MIFLNENFPRFHFFYSLPKKQEINKSIYLKDSNEWPIVTNTNQLMMTIIIKIQGWFSLKKDWFSNKERVDYFVDYSNVISKNQGIFCE